MPDTIVLVIATVLSVLLFVLLLLFVYRRKDPKDKTGRAHGRAYQSEKAVGAMRAFARSNSFRLLAPVSLKRGEAVAELDVVVVGYFGVLGVIALGYGGEVYGDANEDTWLQVAEDKSRNRFQNPVNQCAEAVRALRDALFAAKMKKVPVEVVYVFTNDKAQLALPRSLNHMTMKPFKAMLKKEKYLDDCGLDLDAVEAAIRGAAEESKA